MSNWNVDLLLNVTVQIFLFFALMCVSLVCTP